MVDPSGTNIGYVGLAHSKGSHEKALKINGVGCNARTIKRKSYALYRYDADTGLAPGMWSGARPGSANYQRWSYSPSQPRAQHQCGAGLHRLQAIHRRRLGRRRL